MKKQNPKKNQKKSFLAGCRPYSRTKFSKNNQAPYIKEISKICESSAIKAESFDVILILGGLHTMMSYVGSIGTLMDGSGLKECFETEFGSNTVPKIMEGKAIARATWKVFVGI